MIETSVMTAKALLMTMMMQSGPVDDFILNETYCMAQNANVEITEGLESFFSDRGDLDQTITGFHDKPMILDIHITHNKLLILVGNDSCSKSRCISKRCDAFYSAKP